MIADYYIVCRELSLQYFPFVVTMIQFLQEALALGDPLPDEKSVHPTSNVMSILSNHHQNRFQSSYIV